jgi:hypothetical protein
MPAILKTPFTSRFLARHGRPAKKNVQKNVLWLAKIGW